MKYENLFKIHIPEPCHEDWDKMTPNTQGAFCNSCAKTVVDFSGKSDEEVQKYLLENIDKKICGRFLPSQLDEEPAEEPKLKIALEPQPSKWNFPTYLMPIITPFRIAAMSLMLFASLALSSCGNSNEAGGNDDGKTVGIMVVVPDSTQAQDSTNNDINNKVKGDIDLRVQGGVTIDRVRNQDKYNKNSSDSTCQTDVRDIKTFGKIMVTPKTDTIKVDSSETRMIKGEIAPQKDPPRKMGMIKKKDK
jgi:hypothetical protein